MNLLVKLQIFILNTLDKNIRATVDNLIQFKKSIKIENLSPSKKKLQIKLETAIDAIKNISNIKEK